MIKQLRRKFILINLLLVGLALLVVFGVLIGANSRRMAEQSRSALFAALEWREGETPPRFAFSPPPAPEQDPPAPGEPEPPPSLVPVFVVTARDGQALCVNDGGQVEVSTDLALQALQAALDTGAVYGTLPQLRLRFQMRWEDDAVRAAFADQSWELDSLRTLVLSCLLVWLLAMGGFFLISRLLAGLALRPAEQAWQQQRQFVADASHELKTPLTVILANTSMVLAHPGDTVAAQAKWLDYTREEAQHMRTLVEDLLFLAKSDAARQVHAPLPVNLSQLTLSCLLPFEPVAFEGGLALDSRITPGLHTLGDEGQLRRLVLILLDNAVKYTPTGGGVTLTLARRQDRLSLTLHNTGAPIPPQHLPHLFERFYRADPARERTQGSCGLGLAIAKSIVQAHRGKIFVTSTAGDGTCFTVLLPALTP